MSTFIFWISAIAAALLITILVLIVRDGQPAQAA
jgi:hypothetical protein